jgi:GNAT superfamily N-acetyltransferase
MPVGRSGSWRRSPPTMCGHWPRRHWPRCRTGGLGTALMGEAERIGRSMGLAALHVTVRAGTNTEKFYERLGYTEVGRLPGALRVGPDDERDEIFMWMPLR